MYQRKTLNTAEYQTWQRRRYNNRTACDACSRRHRKCNCPNVSSMSTGPPRHADRRVNTLSPSIRRICRQLTITQTGSSSRERSGRSRGKRCSVHPGQRHCSCDPSTFVEDPVSRVSTAIGPATTMWRDTLILCQHESFSRSRSRKTWDRHVACDYHRSQHRRCSPSSCKRPRSVVPVTEPVQAMTTTEVDADHHIAWTAAEALLRSVLADETIREMSEPNDQSEALPPDSFIDPALLTQT